jgi:large subunit ribosomal protein L21
MYAIIETGSKQYKVSVDDFVEIEKLAGNAGDKVTFDKVLAVKKDDLKIGNPTLDGVVVEAEIVDQFRAKKVWAFKMKRRKSYRRTIGHRQNLTRVRITAINA